MKSITIHAIDDQLSDRISRFSREHGQSLNRTVKDLLGRAFGLSEQPAAAPRPDFGEFCGVWSQTDAAGFEAAIAETRTVDPEDWK